MPYFLQSGGVSAIDNQTEIGGALVDADEVSVYQAASGNYYKALISRISTYVFSKTDTAPTKGDTTVPISSDAAYAILMKQNMVLGGGGLL